MVDVDHWADSKISNLLLYKCNIFPTKGELSALIKQNPYHRERVEGRSRSVIQDCGCDQEGRN